MINYRSSLSKGVEIVTQGKLYSSLSLNVKINRHTDISTITFVILLQALVHKVFMLLLILTRTCLCAYINKYSAIRNIIVNFDYMSLQAKIVETLKVFCLYHYTMYIFVYLITWNITVL